MQNNFGQVMQMVMSSKNPKECVINLLKQNSGNNPMLSSVIDMMSSGNNNQVEAFVRNMCKEKGVDPDVLYKNVMKYMR